MHIHYMVVVLILHNSLEIVSYSPESFKCPERTLQRGPLSSVIFSRASTLPVNAKCEHEQRAPWSFMYFKKHIILGEQSNYF